MWYLDNGASNHMTGFRSKFKSLDESITGQVRFGEGSTVDIKGKGLISFKCNSGSELVFNEVYYIPDLCNNIISLGQLSEIGNKIVLKGVFLWVYDGQGKLIMKVKRSENRLYRIVIETTDNMCLVTKLEESSWLWHSRLGHVNFQAMTLMSANKMATGLPNLTQPKKTCTGCLLSKQTRKPISRQTEFHTTQILELVHGDIWGPISPEMTGGGNMYFFLLVDDFSREMWIYMLKNKNEAFTAFKRFIILVEKNTERRIKVFRTDRGGEFTSK